MTQTEYDQARYARFRRDRETTRVPLSLGEIAYIRSKFGVSSQISLIEESPGNAVTACGRVFSKVLKPGKRLPPCVHELGYTPVAGKYRSVRYLVGDKVVSRLVHRLVAMAFLAPPSPEQTVVRHLDGDPGNNAVENLAWGTQKDNMQDCVSHGRTLKGLKNPNAKLTPVRARIAKELTEDGFSCQAVAEFFGVTSETIRRAAKGESWN